MVSISVKKSLLSLPVAVSESGEGGLREGGREGGRERGRKSGMEEKAKGGRKRRMERR